MKPKQNDPLESWASQTLRQLPDRRAPAGLSRGVMAEIQRRQDAPWYTQPWMEWNLAAKLASATALPALGFVVWDMVLPAVREAVLSASVTREAATTFQTALAVGDAAASIGRAGWLTLSHAHPMILAGVAGVFALAWFSTLGLGTAAWRLARNND